MTKMQGVFSGRSTSQASASAEAGWACRHRDETCGELRISFSTFVISHRQGFEGSSCSLAPRCLGVTPSDGGMTLGDLL